MSIPSRVLRRNAIADDPQPELSALDRLDLDRLDGLERSMADRPAGKRRPAVRPVPESLEEALADDDLLAVARGAGVVRDFPGFDHPGWERLLEAVRTHDANAEANRARQLDAAADAALRCYRETENADLAMETFERLSAVA